MAKEKRKTVHADIKGIDVDYFERSKRSAGIEKDTNFARHAFQMIFAHKFTYAQR